MKVLVILAGVLAIMHGVAHLAGVKLVWPQGVATYPLAGGRWQAGPQVRRLLVLLWLLGALGFFASGAGWLMGLGWWRPLMAGTAVLSMVLIALDWKEAFRGAIVNLLLLVGVALL